MDNQTIYDRWMQAKGEGISRREFAASLGMSDKRLDNLLYAAKQERRTLRPPAPLPEGFSGWDLGKPWSLAGDWMIVGDVHVPFTDLGFAMRTIDVAKKMLKRPRRLLVAGDFFNMDYFSSYAQIVQLPSWHEERKAARALLIAWLKCFDEVRFLMGNHDRRMQKFLAGAFDETDLVALLTGNTADEAQIDASKISWSNWGWCTIESPTGPWRVTHPRNYSINQLTVADQLALKYQSHIISHHEHHVGMGWDRFKRFVIINNGMLADQEKMAYVVLDDSKSAGMAKSFVVLKNGHAQLFAEEPFTDWEAW